jgi:hypothetical protein
MATVNINNTDNQVTAVNANQGIIVIDNSNQSSINVTQPVTSVVLVNALGPIGPAGPQGPSGSGGSGGDFVTTSSFNAFTGSYNTGSFTGSFTGSLFGTASWAFSSSQALTASYVANIVTFPYTGSAIITGSLTVTGSINATSITSSLFGTSSWAQSASQALTASFLPVATYQITSSWAVSSSRAITSSYALTASYITASNVQGPYGSNSILSASYSLSASYVSPGGSNTYVQFNSNNTFAGDSALTYDSEKQLNTLRLNVKGRLILEGMIAINNSDSPYTVDRDTSVILCDTSAGPISIDIDSTAVRGRILTIKDIGNASSNNITFGGSTIDGGAFSVINIDKQSIIIIRAPGSGEWYIIGSHN